MNVKVKLFSVGGVPASDGSIIPRHVVEEFLASDKYKNAISEHSMLGTLTHRARNIQTGVKNLSPGISKVVGRDDLLITVGEGLAPTHYITKIEINDSDQWVYATAKILPEDGMDDEGKQLIRRLTALLKEGCGIGCSAVILGYWKSEQGKGDVLSRMVQIKSFDFTMNPSWKDAHVTEIYDDSGNRLDEMTRTFSDTFRTDGTMKVKVFSDLDSLGVQGMAKSSKIDNQYTILKAKQFSVYSNVVENGEGTLGQKEFTAATLKERLRMSSFSPRMRFRRIFLDYKQLVKQLGGTEKMDPEVTKKLKSLFATDVLDVIKGLNNDIMAGKNINTLIGAGSLGKSVRVAGQKLQIPYRMAMQEVSKRGVLSPVRYKNLQEAYLEFVKSMTDEVFGSNPIPEGLEESVNKEEEALKK